MTEPIEDGVTPQDPGTATPATEGTPQVPYQEPLPGQPDPSDPQGEPTVEKTVPLAALHEERSKRQEMQAELEVMKQLAGTNVLFDINGKPVQQQQAVPGGQAQSPQQQPNQAAQELEQLWESDPRKAVQVEIMAAMSWRDNMEAQTDSQLLQAGGKYDDFGQYENVVKQYIRALPVEQRAKPGVVDLAYYVVKGQNTGNAVDRAKSEMLRKIQAGEEVQGLQQGTRSAQPVSSSGQATPEQAAVAEQMGLTVEQYMSEVK